MPTLVTLDGSGFTATALTTEGQAFSPSASPDGSKIAFVLDDSGLDERNPGDSEVALVATDGGGKGLRLLTRNALRDHSPRFTADGSHVVFETRVEIPKTDWRITAARAVTVD
jgi:Tol biopolymer transport system component